jgi:hypothetical protein
MLQNRHIGRFAAKGLLAALRAAMVATKFGEKTR